MVYFAVRAEQRIKLKERETKDKYVDLARELKKKQKTMEYESNGYTNCDWCFRYSHQMIFKENRRLGNKMTRGDPPNNYIIENG